MASVLIPVPSQDFDPREAAVPWTTLTALGDDDLFATPDDRPGQADERTLTGRGLGNLKTLLMANANGRQAYAEMAASPAFRQPWRHAELSIDDFDGLVLPGGHAPGMQPYLESPALQALVCAAFAQDKPLGAICHGVVQEARTRAPDGRSIRFGKKTTALTKTLEFTGWAVTAMWLGNYYRTYPTGVQDEVCAALANPADFIAGPAAVARAAPNRLSAGFTVRARHCLSARWPGDTHRFASKFAAMLGEVGTDARQVGGARR